MSTDRVALFDLDHTLLAHNSGVLYARDCLRRGRISVGTMFRTFMYAGLHWLGRLNVEEMYRRTGEIFAGESGEQIRAEVDSWFHGEVAQHLRPGARAVLEQHRVRGERMLLVTNSSSFIASAAVKAWGLDGFIANEVLVDAEGRITGNVSTPICYGEGKLARTRSWAQAEGVDLSQAYFYSDSISDLPLLQQVASPHVVHPDPRLKRVARERDWPILLWGRSSRGRLRLRG